MDPPRSSQDSSTQSAPGEPPHGGHEDSPPTVLHTASFRKPVPLVPIAMPSPTTSREALSSSPAPQTPPLFPVPSNISYAQPTSATQTTSNAVAGPSRLPQPTQSLIQESDEEEKHETGSSGPEGGRQPSIYSRSGNGNGNGGGNGHYGPSNRSASLRRPDRAASYHGTVRMPEGRYPVPLPRTMPATPTGMDPVHYGAELNPEAMMSRQSQPRIDWIVPNVPTMGQNPVNRRMSQVTTIVAEKTVGERIEPTLEAAREEKVKAEGRARVHSYALNVAIGAQVILGALTTGVAAATSGRQTSIATSVLGGMSTLAASYLAKARGSGEPEDSTRKAQDLKSFIRDCEAFKLDHGHKIGPDHDDMINRYRRRFEEIMGNEFEGVGDDMKVQRKQREKLNDSPV
ncbi:hypothetical protein L226DRAFT_538281 [Lentinus tigrinus ALCF2SS1-7]|uniref:SMODS and SLOG-associating 2TM effector domain-containing protein n=1 Tax=Lentinus tigrinus ALCF2SS1-6 TaxID=1328759 RepID=A0A5C2S0H4_9APHY|nr:hypothetical protein L227DRAFT_578475 [Lentinus tigrinus ALCF2SS1-6]RPD71152.1 hypothetical protein L226DRAFT_538281 [Lentinus tigrinus ALCF2SS1-7]